MSVSRPIVGTRLAVSAESDDIFNQGTMHDFSSHTIYESVNVYCRDAHWASEKLSYSRNVGGRPMVVPTISHKGYANHFHTNRPLQNLAGMFTVGEGIPDLPIRF